MNRDRHYSHMGIEVICIARDVTLFVKPQPLGASKNAPLPLTVDFAGMGRNRRKGRCRLRTIIEINYIHAMATGLFSCSNYSKNHHAYVIATNEGRSPEAPLFTVNPATISFLPAPRSEKSYGLKRLALA